MSAVLGEILPLPLRRPPWRLRGVETRRITTASSFDCPSTVVLVGCCARRSRFGIGDFLVRDSLLSSRASCKGQGRGWDVGKESHARASGGKLAAAGACAVPVGAARDCNGSASLPSHAGHPNWERANCDGARCSGEDRRGERHLCRVV